MSSSFGRILRLTTFGESHGTGLGGILEGCPPGVPVDPDRLQRAMDRRRPGQSRLTTTRAESDRVELLSGVFEGRTTGTPIGFVVRNEDVDSSKYDNLRDTFRPGHADYTYFAKYGHRDHRGGGRASARETAIRVAAGALAEMLLDALAGDEPAIDVVAWVDAVGDLVATVDEVSVSRADVDANDVRCPDASAAVTMEALIKDVRAAKDTIGGTVRCVARNLPPGLGEPVFDKLTARLGQAMMSLPASRGFEVGDGFASIRMRGSQHNDPFTFDGDRIRTTTNHHGGVLGGISSGAPLRFRVAFKPVATLFLEQDTVDSAGEPVRLKVRGRHDPCVLPRAVPIVEAMTSLVLADLLLVHRASAGLRF